MSEPVRVRPNGHKIVQYRTRIHGWTQADLARHSGWGIDWISKAERGHPVSLPPIKDLARLFGIPWPDLVVTTTPIDECATFADLLARAEEQHWLFPVLGSPTRLFTEPEEFRVQHTLSLGSRFKLGVMPERSGYLLLLDFSPEGTITCLCPSVLARETQVEAHDCRWLPQKGARSPVFAVEGQPGTETLLGILTERAPRVSWMAHAATSIREMTPADFPELKAELLRLQNQEAAHMTLFRSSFTVTASPTSGEALK